MKILLVGDIVGSPGRKAFAEVAARYRQEGRVDFIIANGENSAGGRGITPPLCDELFDAGADIITLGDHVWDQKDLLSHLDGEPRVLRPANYTDACPGRGWVTVETPVARVTVIDLVGRVFLQPADCPFRAVDAILKKEGKAIGDVVIVDLHAEATSEKIAMGWHLDGRASVVVGTHTHVQTSDERILPNGTAYLTDLGMTGPKDSVLGRDKESILRKFVTGLPAKFKMAENDVVLEGLIVDVDHHTGKANSVERIRERIG